MEKSQSPSLLILELDRALESSLAAGHPWIYRDRLPPRFSAESGRWVRVRAGRFVGYALWDARSPIALRIFSERGVPDEHWVGERVRAAWELREPLRAQGITAYRWIYGESDGLPGLVVDLYAGFAVVVLYAESLDAILPWVVSGLRATTNLEGIVRRRLDAPEAERLELVWGRWPPSELVVEEHGVKLPVDLRASQKTGLYLDQRDNRRRIADFAAGRRVLNLFSYTGGFSVHAALRGAAHVTSVDGAAPAIAAAIETFRLNGVDPEQHTFVVADVFEWLERAARQNERFDLVISDPPSFARSKEQLSAAKKAYLRLMTLGLRVTRPGGFYVGASCTAQLDLEAFRELLAEAARRACVRLQIVHEAGQPLDHPVMAGHREGRYLKLCIGRVLKLV